MAQRPSTDTSGAPKTRKPRSPSPPKAAYFIVQVLDEAGNPMLFDKARVKIIGVENNADRVLEIVESNAHPHAFYLRGYVGGTRAPNPAPQAVPQAA